MLIALQLQSFPAMAMLLCQDNLPTRVNHEVSHAQYHVNQQSEQQSEFSNSCDDCIFCHASFNFSTPLYNPFLSVNFNSTIFLFYIPHFYQFISELPPRPPKKSS